MAGRPCKALMDIKVSIPGDKKRTGRSEDWTCLREDSESLSQAGILFTSAKGMRPSSTLPEITYTSSGRECLSPHILKSDNGALRITGVFSPHILLHYRCRLNQPVVALVLKNFPTDSNVQPKLRTTIWEQANKKARVKLEGKAE